MSQVDNQRKLLELSGSVKNIIFRNEKNGYTVLEICAEGEEVVAVGTIPLVSVGEDLRLVGTWKTHSNFGTQFSVETYERFIPKTKDSILRYLSSGAIKGIGKAVAKRLVDAFEDKTLDIIENHPEKLSALRGISKAKAENICNEYKKIFGIKELIAYLEKFAVTSEESIKIWQRFGKSSIDTIKSNPYIICNDPILISFDKADMIAESLEISNDASDRICAGILYVLTHNMNNGHTCLPCDKLVDATSQFLGIDSEKIADVLSTMKENGQIVLDVFNDKEFAFLVPMYNAETYSSKRILMMLSSSVKKIDGIESQINSIEQRQGIKYATLQREAIYNAITKGVLILTGGPGTGKTTTLNAIIDILSKKGQKVLMAAPTGRAVQRMSQITGFEAKTIHRLLEVEWSDEEKLAFRKNENNLLKCDALVLDEVSMIDVTLFESVLRALPLGCRLIMVGDSDQLPPVGAGNVLGDLIKSGVVPVVQLKEIFRQSMKSLIVTNAHKIVRGEMPELDVKTSDFFFLKRFNTQEVLDTIVDLCTRRLPKTYKYSPISDIQVLCPSRKGVLGTANINSRLQEKINPASIGKNEISVGGVILREGDKVMQVKNNYDVQFTKDDGEVGEGVFNGDVGTLIRINKRDSRIVVKFDDRTAIYDMESAFNLELAYAITVHKSQGNEFEAVVMPMMCNLQKLAYRNLLYTAVTRAKSLMVTVGEKESIARMVNNDKKTRRYSGMFEFLNRGVT